MRKLIFIAAIVVGFAAAAYLFFEEPYGTFQNETFVRIERGTGTVEIGRTLAQAGVIRYPWQLWMERAMHPGAKLQAGEYRFNHPATAAEVFDRLGRGDVYYFELTVPEGSNIFDIARILETSGTMPGEDFLKAASDPASIQDLDSKAQTLEGYLFPSTYRVSHSTMPAELCRQMTDQFRKQWKKLAAAPQHRTCMTPSRWRRWWKRKPAWRASGRWWRECLKTAFKNTCCCNAIRPRFTRRCWRTVIATRFTSPIWPARIRTIRISTPAFLRVRSPIRGAIPFGPRCVRPKQNTCILSPSPRAADIDFPRISRDMKKRLKPTVKKRGKRDDLGEWLQRTQLQRIGEAEFDELRAALAPVSDRYLTKLLRESGVPLEPLIAGVRQSNLEELETSLLALLEEYSASGAPRRRRIRGLVITAKDHAVWSARRAENPAQKREMILWMTTWLENPLVFREWVMLRLKSPAREKDA